MARRERHFSGPGAPPSLCCRSTACRRSWPRASAIAGTASGAGIALGQKLLARRDLDEGRLVSPFGPSLRLGVTYCLVYPPDKAKSPLLAGFLAWLRRHLPGGEDAADL